MFAFVYLQAYSNGVQAAFDPRVLSSVCFFATDIHSATLGKGKNDDSLTRVRKGDLTNKGELVVRVSPMRAARQVQLRHIHADDIRQAGEYLAL